MAVELRAGRVVPGRVGHETTVVRGLASIVGFVEWGPKLEKILLTSVSSTFNGNWTINLNRLHELSLAVYQQNSEMGRVE